MYIIINQITKILDTKYPIIQAPMLWLTDANFVAEVSNQGGLGTLDSNPGQTTRTRDDSLKIERIKNEIQKTKELTSNNFGLNINILDASDRTINFNTKLINIALNEGVKYFVIDGQTNKKIFNLIKQNNGVIIYRPITPTIKQAKIGEQSGADILVATGIDEGGILPQRSIGTFSVLQGIVEATNIPVMAAGGIVNNNTTKAAMNLGAQGIYVGTRFIVTNENRASQNTKNLIIKSTSDDIEFVSPSQRSIQSKQADALNKAFNNPKINNNNLDKEIGSNGYLKTAMLDGDIDNGIIITDTAIDSITSQESIKNIIQNFFNK